jgi:hypothetical protein
VYAVVTSQQLCRRRRERRPSLEERWIGAVAIRGRIDAEAVAHSPDVFCVAKQADAVSTVLTLQAKLFKDLTELTHMLYIYVAVGTHAPLGGRVVDIAIPTIIPQPAI